MQMAECSVSGSTNTNIVVSRKTLPVPAHRSLLSHHAAGRLAQNWDRLSSHSALIRCQDYLEEALSSSSEPRISQCSLRGTTHMGRLPLGVRIAACPHREATRSAGSRRAAGGKAKPQLLSQRWQGGMGRTPAVSG